MKKILLSIALLICFITTNAQVVVNPSASSGSTVPVQRVGGIMLFDTGADYNATTPFNGALSFDFTGAKAGVQAFMYYNGGTFTAPANSVFLGGAYQNSQTNLIKFTYISNTRVYYEIVSPATAAYVNPITYLDITPAQSTVTTFTNMLFGNSNIPASANIALEANTSYEIRGVLRGTSATAAGIGFNVTWPLGISSDAIVDFYLSTTQAAYQRVELNTTTTSMSGTTAFVKVAASAPVEFYAKFTTTNAGSLNFGMASATAGVQTNINSGSITIRKTSL